MSLFVERRKGDLMEREIQLLSPENLPLDLGELGVVTEAEAIIPGVYEASMRQEGSLLLIETFIVLSEAPSISAAAKKYGKYDLDYPGLLVYGENCSVDSRCIIAYELCRYKKLHGIPLSPKDSMRISIAFGRELHPEYFGPYAVPQETPWGRTTRYKVIANGVFWLESEWCQRGLAVSFPVYDNISKEAAKLAVSFNPKWELPYIFFLEEDSCVPVFELALSMAEGDLLCSIDPYALMNALYIQHPDYAVSKNAVEQAGIHLGGIVSFTPESGTEYISF